ncbi:MAG: DUF2339 domain-containing protein [Acidobacteriaceae bacterium]|nr:DUF2339 domain-containing protein [Acidobacteriaceae bacterium]
MPSDEQIDRLNAQVERLSTEVAQLRQRVADLERARSLPTPAPTLPPRAPVAPSANAGLKLLNRAGALTLFIGILFFFKYAVDNRWIGAAGRVLLGAFAGLALLLAGQWLRKRGQSIFAQGVSGCGIATLYISAYAAAGYYKLINPVSAFLLLLAISAVAVILSIRSSDVLLAFVGYIGAILAPGLFRYLDPNIWSANVWSWFGFVYLLIIDALVLIEAGLHARRFLVPAMAAAVALQTFYLINPQHPVVCVVFFLAMAALHFRPPKNNFAEAYVIGHIFVLLAGFRLLVFWFGNVGSIEARSSLLSESESVLLGVYGLALLASAVLRKSSVDRVIGLTLLAIVIGKLYVVDVWLLTRVYRISAFVALGLLLLASSFIYSRWKQRVSS